jgi:hypothetical protein
MDEKADLTDVDRLKVWKGVRAWAYFAPHYSRVHLALHLMKRLVNKFHPIVYLDVAIDGVPRGRVALEVRRIPSRL